MLDRMNLLASSKQKKHDLIDLCFCFFAPSSAELQMGRFLSQVKQISDGAFWYKYF